MEAKVEFTFETGKTFKEFKTLRDLRKQKEQEKQRERDTKTALKNYSTISGVTNKSSINKISVATYSGLNFDTGIVILFDEILIEKNYYTIVRIYDNAGQKQNCEIKRYKKSNEVFLKCSSEILKELFSIDDNTQTYLVRKFKEEKRNVLQWCIEEDNIQNFEYSSDDPKGIIYRNLKSIKQRPSDLKKYIEDIEENK
jgi:hypothetical protein